jgi:stage III sporulation protein SpoIIIAA
MAKATWHAYYFDSFDRSSPASRTAIIEAESEEAAGKLAIAQMGRAMRVHVTRPVWGGYAAAKPAARSMREAPTSLTGAA